MVCNLSGVLIARHFKTNIQTLNQNVLLRATVQAHVGGPNPNRTDKATLSEGTAE